MALTQAADAPRWPDLPRPANNSVAHIIQPGNIRACHPGMVQTQSCPCPRFP